MRKIGHSVLFLQAEGQNPRNGESTFARLNDGRLMMAFTEYYGMTSWEDHATARLSACYSSDEGETWTAPSILIEKAPDAQNIMSPSLLRLANGELGIVYLRKDVTEDGMVTCVPVFSASGDEGKTWSDPVYCYTEPGYICVINDGCMVDRSGRIWVPMSYSGKSYDAFGSCALIRGNWPANVIRFSVSDDCGKTWTVLDCAIESPYHDSVALEEPGLFEFEDGRLWVYCRTAYGNQYQSFSEDRGLTWSPARPNFCFTSPDSPMRVKRVGNYVAAVFNPRSFSCMHTATEVWKSPKRTPLVCAISRDGAHSFDTTDRNAEAGQFLTFASDCYLLEDDESNSYCYPGIIETKDGFLVTYYHSNNTPVCLNSTKVVKVTFDEIEKA